MEKESPNYYAIIPANVRYDKRLKDKAKLLYGDITALSNKNGYCYASNRYFANLYGIAKMTVSQLIKNLEENHYIKTIKPNLNERKFYRKLQKAVIEE